MQKLNLSITSGLFVNNVNRPNRFAWYFSYLVICCLTIILPGSGNLAFGQAGSAKPEVQNSKEELEERIYMVVEKQPEFPGGEQAKKKFFSRNLVTPKNAPKMKGRVFVSFVVNRDGSLQDVTIFKSLHAAYDQEALRVVLSMPKWNPGMQSGRTLRVKYMQPVEFQ